MEYALGEWDEGETHKEREQVLILVVMEYALGASWIIRSARIPMVLILVVMEYALGELIRLFFCLCEL